MSPELEKLLEAYHAKLTCPPEEKFQRVAGFERLLHEAWANLPGTSRDALLESAQEPLSGFPQGPPKNLHAAAEGLRHQESVVKFPVWAH